MGLDAGKLKDDIEQVFAEMQGDDKKFSQGLSKAFKDFIESGLPSTTDTGTVSAGTFTGASTEGHVEADDSECEEIIFSACNRMKSLQVGGDAVLALALSDGLQAVLDSAKVYTKVSGTATPPPPASPVPLSGTAEGELQGSAVALVAGLTACFASMAPLQSGGDTLFATQLSSLISTVVHAPVTQVVTHGVGALAGSSGTGSLS